MVELFGGSPGNAGSEDGTGTEARFNGPSAIVFDPRGFLFVAEPNAHLVRRVRVDTAEVTTFAGTRGEGGVKPGPLPAALNTPSGLALLPSGELVISDSAENAILITGP